MIKYEFSTKNIVLGHFSGEEYAKIIQSAKIFEQLLISNIYDMPITDKINKRNLNLWDMASGVLLVREAGGEVTEPNGNPWNISSKNILASNSCVHKTVLEKLA